ncbi:MAG: glycosyltransferase [Bacteroidales bacterium]|nr:glycosyltransferase [Bacteroidales bacterium]MCF8332519.1 glycosyltransferase [Bacteroidales bacterium]
MEMEDTSTHEKTAPVICFCNTAKAWGGGEKWHYDMALMLKNQGYRVFTITAKNSALQQKYLASGLKNISIGINNLSFLNPFMEAKLRRFFSKNPISVIIMNLPSDLKTAGPAAQKAGVSKIIYRRGSAIPVNNSILNRYLYRNILDLVLVNSKATRDTILTNNPHIISREKIRVLYNGLKLENYNCGNGKANEKHQIVIGSLGRFVKQKGLHRFIEIAEKLREKGVPFKIILGGEGKLKADIRHKIKEKSLEEYFVLPGFVDDTARFMNEIDVFVLTSYWEGFGYVIAEAMACRRPVIGFNVSSNPELIKDGKNGFLIDNGNIESLVEKIEYLHYHPDERKTLGKNGRRMAEEEFDIIRVRDELIRIIEQ